MNKLMNKSILPLLVALVGMTASLTAQNDTVYLSFVPSDIKCGETKGIKLRVKNFTNIVSMNFSMHYNKNLINLKNFTGENANAQLVANDATLGDVAAGQTFSYSKATPITVADGDFFLLNFEPKAESGGLSDSLRFSGTPVAFKFEALVAGGKKTLPYKFTNAQFRIIDDIPPIITCPTARYVMLPITDNAWTGVNIEPTFQDVSCGKATLSYTLSGATVASATPGNANGIKFNNETTNILYTVKDNSGNSASCQTQIIVSPFNTAVVYNTSPIVKCTDSTFTIETRVANYKNITATDYDFMFDKNVLALKSIDNLNATVVAAGNVGFASNAFVNQGKVKVSFTAPAGLTLPDNTLLYTLTFRKIAGAASTGFSFDNLDATDVANGTNSINFESVVTDVTFEDTETPILKCPKDTILYTTTASPNEVQLFGIQATATDNCELQPINYSFSGATQLTSTVNPNGKFFKIGVTNVNTNAKDFAGNTATCIFKVTVIQPALSLASDTIDCRSDSVTLDLTLRDFMKMKKMDATIDWNKDSLEYRRITFKAPFIAVANAIATLNGTGNSLGIAFNSTDPNGTSVPDNQAIAQITFKAKNAKINDKYKFITAVSLAKTAADISVSAKGNIAYLSILDTDAPKIIACPKDTLIKTDKCFADYAWTAPSVVDFCSAIKDTLTNAPGNAVARVNAGSKPTTFFYQYRDKFDNKNRCEFKVTVLDTIKPKINNCIVTDTLQLATSDILGVCGAIFNGFPSQPTIIESCAYTRTENYQIGSTVQVGLSKYIITVKDTSGNKATCERFVNVTDRTGPAFEIGYFASPTKIVYAAADKCGANFTWIDPKATDACGGTVTVTADKTNGSFFPVSNVATKITFTATDEKGNKTIEILNVIVIDTIPAKFVNCPTQPVNLYSNLDCEAIYVAPTIQYTDNCALTPQNATLLTPAPANNIYTKSTELFYGAPQGATCKVTINVQDTLKPLIDCPISPITGKTSAGNCFKVFPLLPPPINLSDNCGAATFTSSATQIQYPVGTTTITYTAKDVAGNTKTCSFNVIITDETKPILSNCPSADVTVKADLDKSTAAATWVEPTATDNCGNGKVKITSNYANNATFAIGKTVVTYTAKDSSNNSVNCAFNVIVIDDQKPKFVACPSSPISQSAATNCEYTFSLLKSIAVNDNHKITFRDSTGTRPNGKYAIGSYPITYIAKDSTGNDATCAFTLQIIDKAAPKKLTCPAPADNTFLAQAGACDFTLTSISQLKFPTFKDDCDASLKYDTLHWSNNIWTKGLPPNLVFKAGETQLAVIAKDAAMNSDTCFFNVVVTGNVKPSIAAADCGVGNITAKATGCTTTLATPYTSPAVVFSPCSAKDTAGYNFAPNKAFAIGKHTIVYTAKDKNNNTATCSFTVTIEDKDAPTITFKKDTIVVVGTECFQTAIWDAPTVKDLPCDTIPVKFTPTISFGVFQAGISTMEYKATDKSGNTSTKNLYIQVIENQNPTFVKCPKNVEVSIDGMILADPDNILDNTLTATNGKCDSIKLAYKITAFEATDNCDGNVTNFIFPTQYLPNKANNYALGENKISVTAQDKSKNKGVCEFKIIVKPFSIKPNATVSDEKPCAGDAIMLKVDSIAGATANWSATNSFVSTKSANSLKSLTPSNSGSYYVFYQKNNCKSPLDTVSFVVISAPTVKADSMVLQAGTTKSANVTINDILIKNAPYKVTWETVTSTLGTFAGKDNGEFYFEAKKGINGSIPVRYDLCYDGVCPDACIKNQTLWITITKDIPSECQVSNLITPNGDGFNDELEIDCIGSATTATMTIFSQWGEIVFSSKNYNGKWDAKWKGKDLPDGTYFYVFQLNPTATVKKGYITVFR